MKKCILPYLFFLIVSSFTFPALAVEFAFPGAEGYGAISIGGRGGRVIKVTNLNAAGPGSLSEACKSSGPRIIVFEVGGVIHGDVAIRDSNITIAGQTAPEPGITLAGRLFSWPRSEGERLHDIVIRFLRIRPPPTTGYNGDAVQLPNTERVILDHISMSWANDEMIDIIYSSEFTLQWSTIEESDPLGHGKGVPHNFALLSAYHDSGNVSIHHNLFANHSRRIPSLTPEATGKHADFRNNIIYNFREGLGHDGHTPTGKINLVGNYYKRGPSAWKLTLFNFIEKGRYYIEGNYLEGTGYFNDFRKHTISLPFWVKEVKKGGVLEQPAQTAFVTTQSAEEAYKSIFHKAGNFPRDRVTLRTFREVETGTGRWARRAPANPSAGWFLHGLPVVDKPEDSDGDGMPDKWEIKKGLNHLNSNDTGILMASGYSAIETYLNERAKELLQRYSVVD